MADGASAQSSASMVVTCRVAQRRPLLIAVLAQYGGSKFNHTVAEL